MESEFRQLLAELEMLANGPVTSFEGRVTGSKDRSPIMRLRERPPRERYGIRWASARAGIARGLIIADMRKELKAARYAAAPPRDSKPWRELVGKSNRRPAELAREWHITTQYAWQLQQRYGGGPRKKEPA